MQSLAGAKSKASFTLQDNNYGTSYEQIITEYLLNRIHNIEEMDILMNNMGKYVNQNN